jgi:sec-independent protein translocase protein TatA
MGNIGATEILLIALVALLLFGAGRIADIGKGLGEGIRNFKQGLKDEDEKKVEDKKKLAATGDKVLPEKIAPPGPEALEEKSGKAS